MFTMKTEPTANLVTSLILMLCHSHYLFLKPQKKLFRANFRVNIRFVLQQHVEVSISYKKTTCEISFHRHFKDKLDPVMANPNRANAIIA